LSGDLAGDRFGGGENQIFKGYILVNFFPVNARPVPNQTPLASLSLCRSLKPRIPRDIHHNIRAVAEVREELARLEIYALKP